MITQYILILLIFIIMELALLILILIAIKDSYNQEKGKQIEQRIKEEQNKYSLKLKKDCIGKCARCDRNADWKTSNYGNLCNTHHDQLCCGLE